MPTRTIYLNKDQDDLYNKAMEKAGKGNMSSFVMKAVKLYLTTLQEEESKQYTTHVLMQGQKGSWKKVRFEGMFLSSIHTEEVGKKTVRHLYLTRKGNILLYDYMIEKSGERAEYSVYSNLEEMKKKVTVPLELLRSAKEKMNIAEAEYIDV